MRSFTQDEKAQIQVAFADRGWSPLDIARHYNAKEHEIKALLNDKQKPAKDDTPKPEVGDGEKLCTMCGLVLCISEFGKCAHNSDGLRSQCRQCFNAYQAKYRVKAGGKSQKPQKRENGAKIAPKREDLARDEGHPYEVVARWHTENAPPATTQKSSKPKQQSQEKQVMTKEKEANNEIACVILRNVDADYFAALITELQNGDGGENCTCEIVFNESEVK